MPGERAVCFEATEQVANGMVMGFRGEYFSTPCRNVLPVQKPQPSMRAHLEAFSLDDEEIEDLRAHGRDIRETPRQGAVPLATG